MLAFQPWHIFSSVYVGKEILVGFMILLTTFFTLTRSSILFSFAAVVTSFFSFEAWIILVTEALLLWRKTLSKIALLVPGVIAGQFIALSLNPQAPLLITLPFGIGAPVIEISPSPFSLIFLMTFSLFYLGLVFAILKNRESRLMSILSLMYVLSSCLAFDRVPSDAFRLVVIIPLVSVIAASVMPGFHGGVWRRSLVVVALFLILIVPYLSQISSVG
ncbi:MAG: hypothetical protein QW390_04850 [Candidatus Bathyarchaeia archaeon]